MPHEIVFLVAGQSNAEPLGELIGKHLNATLGKSSVVQVAQGGTPLVNAKYVTPSWHPERRGEKYDELLAKTRAFTEALRCKDQEFVIAGLFWMQGEQDTKTANTGPGGQSLPPPPQPLAAESYEANLRLLIQRLRQDLHCSSLPVVIADTPVGTPPDFQLPRSRHAATPVVLAAQAAVARTESGVALVSSAPFERGEDHLHLTPASAAALSEAMVAAWFRIRPPELG